MALSPSFVLETALYASDLEAAEGFYRDVLGLEVLFREEGRHVFFRCGTGVVLLFRAEAARRSSNVPPHGADGAGHVAFAVQDDRLEEWQAHFDEHDIDIEQDKDWGEQGRSLYVRDPAGNSVELATPTLWDTASREDWLLQLRPEREVESDAMGPHDTFQHTTLRPVLELLMPTVHRLVTQRLNSKDDGAPTEEELQDDLRALLTGDETLRHTLVGALLGHFTEDELETYLAHREELEHRFFALLLAHLQDRTDALAEQIGP